MKGHTLNTHDTHHSLASRKRRSMYAKYSGTSGSCHSEARSAQMEVVPRSLSENMSSHFCSTCDSSTGCSSSRASSG